MINLHSKHPHIIATIGPQSGTVETLTKLIAAGAGAFRLNFSWGDFDEHTTLINNIRSLNGEHHVPIIVDLPGPRVQETTGHTYDKDLSPVTDSDRESIIYAVEHDIEYCALSFVQSAADIATARATVPTKNTLRFIAKIERPEAVANIKEILAAADGIMIARGDLGEALPYEELPFTEAALIKAAKAANKPVIVATEMLWSMTERPRPSRAEVTDVAFAVVAGADAVMLSEETTTGQYPIEAVAAMKRIINAATPYIEHSVQSL